MDTIKNIVSSMMGRMSSGNVNPQDIQAAWERLTKDTTTHVADFKNGELLVVADSSMRLVK